MLISFAVNAECSSCFRELPQLQPERNLDPQLYVFVSFSMPEQSLKLWAQQAEKLNARLLLRGFV
jgi:hypothetical protein